jgi:hypothetical protein
MVNIISKGPLSYRKGKIEKEKLKIKKWWILLGKGHSLIEKFRFYLSLIFKLFS